MSRDNSLDRRYNKSHTNSMKTAISIPDSLFDAAERLAENHQITRSELYQRAIRRYLEEHSHQVIREKLDRLYGEDDEPGNLDAAIEYLQSASFPGDDW